MHVGMFQVQKDCYRGKRIVLRQVIVIISNERMMLSLKNRYYN